jgi:hypothetical protein
MTVCVHHIASIEARHDPETHWIEVEFLDRLGQSTKMHWYTLREDSEAEQAFAAEITAALNSLTKFRPAVPAPSTDQGVDQ